jgi:hypothetical protein
MGVMIVRAAVAESHNIAAASSSHPVTESPPEKSALRRNLNNQSNNGVFAEGIFR